MKGPFFNALKRIFFVTLLFVALTACSSDDDEKSDSFAVARQIILGTWVYQPTDIDCESYLTFNDAISFRWESLDEIQNGLYDLTKIEGSEDLHFLELHFTDDNGGVNCEGDAEVDLESVYVDVSFPDMNTLVFSNEVVGLIQEFTRDANSE